MVTVGVVGRMRASVAPSAAYGGVGCGVRGRTARSRAPRSPAGGATAAIDPPCSSHTQLAMASPMPVPPPASSPEPKRSKMRWACSARDAGALVGDHEPPAVRPVGSGAHGDAAAGRAVPVGVVEQVGEHLRETGGVGRDVQVGGHVDDVDGAAPGDAGLRHGALDELADVDRGQRERRAAAVDAAEVEQVADERAEALGLGQRGAQHGVVGTHDAVDEVLEQGLLGGERRAQLVGDRGDELAALLVGAGEVGRHGVEGVGEHPHLVGGRRRDPPGVVAGRHPRRRGGHLAQRGGHAAGQPLGDPERGGDRHRAG